MLHPHPLYGGDMDNHVVTALCEALAEQGATTLRFNFRGAGRSEGAFDGGRGEADDARAAVAALRARADGALVLAGYSFGALVAAGIAGDVTPAALILVSPPAAAASLPPLDPDLPTFIVTGERDQIAPPAALESLHSGRVELAVVPNADHGWWPGVGELKERVSAFLSGLSGS